MSFRSNKWGLTYSLALALTGKVTLGLFFYSEVILLSLEKQSPGTVPGNNMYSVIGSAFQLGTCFLFCIVFLPLFQFFG